MNFFKRALSFVCLLLCYYVIGCNITDAKKAKFLLVSIELVAVTFVCVCAFILEFQPFGLSKGEDQETRKSLLNFLALVELILVVVVVNPTAPANLLSPADVIRAYFEAWRNLL